MEQIIKSFKHQIKQKPWYKIFESHDNKSKKDILDLECQFFERTKLTNGTYKHTDLSRLTDFNELVYQVVDLHSPEKMNIADVAISSGITTIEWCDFLDSKQCDFQMFGSDLYIDSYILYLISKKIYCIVLDHNLKLLEFNLGKIVFSNSLSYSPLNWIPYLITKFFLFIINLSSFSKKIIKTDGLIRSGILNVKKIQLVSSLLMKDSRIKVEQEDILKSTKNQKYFNLIRAANILNKAYFDDKTIAKMVSMLAKKLKKGGYLAVCRTNSKGQNNGSVFRLETDNSFIEVGSIGDGSEIKHLVESKLVEA